MTGEIIDYINRFPNRCFIIDNLPNKIPAENCLKFDQVEKIINNRLYDAMLKLLTEIWLYKDISFESKILFGEEEMVAKRLRKVFLLLIGRLLIKKNRRISKIRSLKYLLYLSKHNIIDLSIYWDNSSIAIIPSWNSFFTYIKDDNNVEMIKKICGMKGLYFKEWSTC